MNPTSEELEQDEIDEEVLERYERMSLGYGLDMFGDGISWAGFWIAVAIMVSAVLK